VGGIPKYIAALNDSLEGDFKGWATNVNEMAAS
jgi:hypothetical protein